MTTHAAPVTWDAWPEPHKKFATALSLAVPNTPVLMANVLDLARGVVMAADRRPMAMDAAEGNPLDALEKAVSQCESWIAKNVADEIQRERGNQLVRGVMLAASAAAKQGVAVGAEDARQSRPAATSRDRRQASDVRPSVLDKVLAEIPKPLRL
jgi:hypothetical protein